MRARAAGRRYAVPAFVALVLGVALVLSAWTQVRPSDRSEAAGPEFVGHPAYAFDPRNDATLAANATDIFVGRVTAVGGTVGAPTSAPGQTVPQTQFAVEVRVAIKGGATGTVTVNQIGGYDDLLGGTFLFEGDALLAVGDTVVLVTAFVPERGWYQLVAAGYGHLRANDAGLRTRLIARFAGAAGVAVPVERPQRTPRADRGAATETPSPSATETATPPESVTAIPSATEVPVATVTPVPPSTATPPPPTEAPPTDTPVPPLPTDTPVPAPTDTPVPLPTDTPIPVPTGIPSPADTPVSNELPTAAPG